MTAHYTVVASFHQLPVSFRICLKIIQLVYKVLNVLGPQTAFTKIFDSFCKFPQKTLYTLKHFIAIFCKAFEKYVICCMKGAIKLKFIMIGITGWTGLGLCQYHEVNCINAWDFSIHFTCMKTLMQAATTLKNHTLVFIVSSLFCLWAACMCPLR